MRVSAKSDYALRALIELAGRDAGAPVSAEELGRLQEIPHGFLQAILADLRRAGIVISQRGQSGGWRMARGEQSVTVAALLSVIRPHEPVARTKYVVVDDGVTVTLVPVAPAIGLVVVPGLPMYH